MDIRFGPAGNSDSFYAQGHTSSLEMPAWIAGLGLNAFEYSFGRGVRLSTEKAGEIAMLAETYGVQMSVHMPYFINLAATDAEKKEKNIGYFLDSLRVAKALKAKRAVFHPGSASGGKRGEILVRAAAFFHEIIDMIDEEGLGDIVLCPETMGKINQLGDLDEVIALCRVDERVLSTIDFGHLYCRSLGGIRTKEDYAQILDTLENGVGVERARRTHVHFSRMEYTKGGEKQHRTFAETQYGPDFEPLAALFAQRSYTPVCICESKGTMAEDACAMRDMYLAAKASL